MLAISIDGDRLLRDESRCKGCGRCVSVCPEKAVKAEVEDIDAAVEELVGRLEPMADFR
jgi:ferredoxin